MKHSKFMFRLKEAMQMEVESNPGVIRHAIGATVLMVLIFNLPEIITAVRWW